MVDRWGWLAAAALTGFAASYVLSSVLRLPRAGFVAGYTVFTAALCLVYVWREGVGARTQLRRRWVAGLIGGIVFGAVLVRQVLGQPASIRPEGAELLGQLTFYGVIYGVVDALLLSVLPVLALYGSRPAAELKGAGARLRWGVTALLGSALVAAAYHAGFDEFRGARLIQPIIGNTLITLSYLLTGSPLTPLLAHVAMHGAAVVHGAESTMQLPPHY